MNRQFLCSYCGRMRDTAFQHDCVRHPLPGPPNHPKGQHRGALYVLTGRKLTPDIIRLHGAVNYLVKRYQEAEEAYVVRTNTATRMTWLLNTTTSQVTDTGTYVHDTRLFSDQDFYWRMLQADAEVLNQFKRVLREQDGTEEALKKAERMVESMQQNLLTEAKFVAVPCPTCGEPVDFMVGREADEEGEVDKSKPDLVAAFAGQNCMDRIADWQIEALQKDAIGLFKNPPPPPAAPKPEKEVEGNHEW